MAISRTFSPFAKSSKKSPALMNLDDSYYRFLNDCELLLYSRLAVLSKNGKTQCNYTNEQAFEEFTWNRQKTQRVLASLQEFGLISISRGHHLIRKRGRPIRVISLCSTPVVYSGKKGF